MPEITPRRICAVSGTSAQTDQQLMQSWLGEKAEHTRRNFEATAAAFLANLPSGIRAATVEDVRAAIATICEGISDSTARQYALRVKSLLAYALRVGYTRFNAGAVIKVKSDAAGRGARMAKRIISEVEVGLLIRGARSRRDRILLGVIYAAGIRVSEAVSLKWDDVIEREAGRVQLSIVGKGGVERQVVLPEIVSRSLLSLREGAPASAPVFKNVRTGQALTEGAVLGTIKRAAKAAGIDKPISPHWLRHAHASHAIDKGATLVEVKETLGHASVATTSGYLHARPGHSSGLRLDQGVFLR